MKQFILKLSHDEVTYFFEVYLKEIEALYSFHYLLLDKTFLVYVSNEIDEEEHQVEVRVVTDYDYLLNLLKRDYNPDQELVFPPVDIILPYAADSIPSSWGGPRFGGSRGRKFQEVQNPNPNE